MFYEQEKKMFFKRHILLMMSVGLWLGLIFLPQVGVAATLSELVAKAKEEGALNATVISNLTGRTIPNLVTAFKKRFGLDINVSLTPVIDVENYPRAIAETKVGTVPTYDAIEGADVNNISLLGVGGIHKVDGWESLLAEVNLLVRAGRVRPEQISPIPLGGYGFMYASRIGGLLYNPRLISREELPKTHAELADPKYKGRWTQPPWTADWDTGPLVFPEISKEKWLEVVRNAGRNVGAVQHGSTGVQRLLLGEFTFALANTYYVFLSKAKDPQAPIEIAYLKDYNWSSFAFHVVRRGARHPAAATLFSLWMTTPEAESIWQPELFMTQVWGESDLDKKERQFIKESGAKIVDFLSTEKGRDLLAWYATEEGRKYRGDMGKAMRGQ